MKHFFIQLILLAPLILKSETLTVFAAASLSDALQEVGQNFEKETSHPIVFNFTASSTLMRQIQEGAPAHIFISADEAKMDVLEKEKLIENRRNLLANTLALVVPSSLTNQIHTPNDLTNNIVKKIALAEPETVPAGIYAREYLQKIELWKTLQNKIVPTENVRAALAAVESENVEAAFVYHTDALISKKAKLGYLVPQQEGPAIRYPVALIKNKKREKSQLAEQFLRYLSSSNSMTIFKNYGFLTP